MGSDEARCDWSEEKRIVIAWTSFCLGRFMQGCEAVPFDQLTIRVVEAEGFNLVRHEHEMQSKK